MKTLVRISCAVLFCVWGNASGKRTASCVLGVLGFYWRVPWNIRSQSHVCICVPAVCDSSERHLPPSSHPPHPLHTFIRRRRFLDSTFHCHMHPFFNIVNLASSALLLFFSVFFMLYLSFSPFPLLYPSRFFHSLHSGPLRFHRVPCSCISEE